VGFLLAFPTFFIHYVSRRNKQAAERRGTMGLEIRRGRDGKPRMQWYGRYDEDGKAKVVNLGVPIKGTPPPSLREPGTRTFEASRTKAEAALERVRNEAREKGNAEHLTRRLIESKTGRTVEYVRLADLADRWRTLPRETKPGTDWMAQCDAIFKRFADAVPCTFLHEVTPEKAAGHIDALRKTHARKTARNAAQLLRSAFKRLLPPGVPNPFEGAINRRGKDEDGGTVHRRPFTAEELTRLFEAARADDFLFPLVVTAACTGLRRGDVCRLPWKAVDLRAGTVNVKTAKTGAGVQIPIFRPLREVFDAALADREPGATFVFPEAAQMVDANPDGLTWRFKKLVSSIMPDMEDAESAGDAAVCAGREGLAERLPDIEAVVAGLYRPDIAARIVDTAKRYAGGASIRDIEMQTGRVRSGVSADLHAAENALGIRFLPTAGVKGAAAGGGAKARVARLTRIVAAGRVRSASVLDWHALRVTWVTLALSAGVPMEVARLVTGHKTVEVVLRHYFKPGAEHLRAVLGDKLPNVLTGNGSPTPPTLSAGDKLGAFVAELTPAERNRLVAMLVK
jgi:integrase